jgi:hypothetical protein
MQKEVWPNGDHGSLLHLQEFIGEFGRRHADRLPASVARNLAAHRLQTCSRPVSMRLDNVFVAYIDAIGHLDNTRCLLEWKTTSTRIRKNHGDC